MSIRIRLVCFISLCLIFANVSMSHAAKPGGGGAGTNGGGVIYFRWNSGLYTMNDSGGAVTEITGLPFPVRGSSLTQNAPSRQLHAGKRWFFTWLRDPSLALNPFTRRWLYDLVIVNDAGDTVPIFVEFPVEFATGLNWTVGDSHLTFAGRRTDVDPDSPTYGQVIEAGLYAVDVVYDTNGNPVGSSGLPSLIFETAIVTEQNPSIGGLIPGPDMRTHDWSSDGFRFAFNAYSVPAIFVGDIRTQITSLVITDPVRGPNTPRWSPSAERLMINYDRDVYLINIDGSGLTRFDRKTPNQTPHVMHWSPTGTHLTFRRADHFWIDSYIVRATASGGSKTRITTVEQGEGSSPVEVLGWR